MERRYKRREYEGNVNEYVVEKQQRGISYEK